MMSATMPNASAGPDVTPPPRSPKSLAKLEAHASYQALAAVVQDAQSLFACGGSVPIAGTVSHGAEPPNAKGHANPRFDSSSPVTLRWDAPAGVPSEQTKLTLPFEADPSTQASLHELVAHMQPATFGRNSEDVYDESYRRALKMDTSAFCSTFNPYELGIIDTIAQLLLPNINDSPTHRSVHAELYKLNVYAGPTGMFKSHVDTPRSEAQFGSLVVCLPTPHEGGQLHVRHKGQEMVFDWSTSNDNNADANVANAIQWAAFYADCEHEVLPVTSGHRLTLTYNLYAVRGPGRLADHTPLLRIQEDPLYAAFSRVLGSPEFMKKGGKLGYFCAHAYPHTNETEAPMPDTLKGVDMRVWSAASMLGLTPRIRPAAVMHSFIEEDDEEEDDEEEEDDDYDYDLDCNMFLKSHRFKTVVLGGSWKVQLDECYRQEGGEIKKWARKWAAEGLKEGPAAGVRWLTSPKSDTQQLQLAAITYGNEAALGCIYSYCAIIIDVPAAAKRLGHSGATGS